MSKPSCSEGKRARLPSWVLEDLENLGCWKTWETRETWETAGSSTPNKHSSEAMASFSTFKEEAAAPQESDAGKAAPTGSGEKPSWTPDVMLENGLPWTVDQAGNKIFGTFMDAPSKDGMAMVRFPGVALPVEVASLLFEEIGKTRPMKRSKTRPMKRPAAMPKRPASAESTSKKNKTKDTTVDDKDAENDGGEGGRRRKRRRKRNDKDAENDGEEHDAECDGEDGEGGRRRKRKRKRRRKSEGRAE